MALAGNSKGYAGTFADGQVWANLQYSLGNRYTVADQGSVAVTAAGGGTRQVSISAGRLGGWGIYDFNDASELVQLPTVSSGTKWFLIVARRTWATLDGVTNATQFYVIDPGWTSAPATLPAVGTGVSQWNQRPGIRDDQPLAIVPLTAGATVPGTPLDVRLIGSGNNFVANHDWVLQYANWPGIEIQRGTKTYRRGLSTWDVSDSAVRLLSGGAVIVTATGWTAAGPLINQARVLSPLVAELNINVRLTSGSVAANSVGNFPDVQFGSVPAPLRPAVNQPAVPCGYAYASSPTAGASSVAGFLFYRASDGALILQSGAPNTTIYPRTGTITADSFNIRFTWVYALATPYPL